MTARLIYLLFGLAAAITLIAGGIAVLSAIAIGFVPAVVLAAAQR